MMEMLGSSEKSVLQWSHGVTTQKMAFFIRKCVGYWLGEGYIKRIFVEEVLKKEIKKYSIKGKELRNAQSCEAS
jgi:hypothetical protein